MQANDPAMFASQYLNQPIAEGAQLFTEQKLLAACIAAKDSPACSPTVLFIDLASEGNNPDDSVIVAGRVDALGRMYVVDIRGGQFSTSELAIHVIDMALRHRPLRIMFEKTASCQYFVEYLRVICRDKNISLPIDFIKVDNKPDAKNVRVAALEGHIRNKRFFFYVGLPQWDKLVEQACQFPKGRHGHDDYPDTCALMANEFGKQYTPTMRVSPMNGLMRLIEQAPSFIATPEARPARDNDMGDDFSA
jgi:predicted phage terminase large subunit-like protein